MTRAEKLALAFLSFIAFSYIISAAYLAVNGNHAWRQTDVYGHILGFIGTKDFAQFDRFLVNSRDIFDIPIYQFVIAAASKIVGSDPLVVSRFLNLGLWLLTAYAGYRLAETFGRTLAGVIFVYLLATSPLILHYYSVPLPDVMAIAFSIFAVMLLQLKGQTWLGALYALPLLALATLIKSPVPFVFVLFHACCIFFREAAEERNVSRRLARQAPFLTVLAVLLIVAVLAEQLRIILLDRGDFGLAQNPEWYFGTLDQRLSLKFWAILIHRFNISGPLLFFVVYLMVISVALVSKAGRNHLHVTVSGVIAFAAGWLIFANLNQQHDYYQLPGMIIIFVSFAVSLSYLLEKLFADRSDSSCRTTYAVLALALIPISSIQVLSQETLSVRSRPTLFAGIEYALRDQDVFLYVHNGKRNVPTMGGFLSTKFEETTPSDFEDNCAEYMRKYSAIIVNGQSTCLTANKSSAKYYIEDNEHTFFLN